MSLDFGQEKLARKAIERGLPPHEVARVIGAHEDDVRAAWRRLAPQEIGRRATTRAIKPQYAPVQYCEGSASAWTPPPVIVLDRKLNFGAIIKIVAGYYRHHVEKFIGPERFWPMAHHRQLAMFLCRTMLDASLTQIGRAFGGRDHTTVMHACKEMTKKINRGDGGWDIEYEALKTIILVNYPQNGEQSGPRT